VPTCHLDRFIEMLKDHGPSFEKTCIAIGISLAAKGIK